jgi:hypothetical protein
MPVQTPPVGTIVILFFLAAARRAAMAIRHRPRWLSFIAAQGGGGHGLFVRID